MKELAEKKILYYILAPLLLVVWPLALWLFYLPNARDTLQKEKKYYEDAYEVMEELRVLDPQRFEYKKNNNGERFDYTVAVDAAARKLRISSTDYTIRSKPPRKAEGRRTQDCQVIINDINIVKLAEFISSLQITWANLQCQKLTLSKREGAADSWKIDIGFRYYY